MTLCYTRLEAEAQAPCKAMLFLSFMYHIRVIKTANLNVNFDFNIFISSFKANIDKDKTWLLYEWQLSPWRATCSSRCYVNDMDPDQISYHYTLAKDKFLFYQKEIYKS